MSVSVQAFSVFRFAGMGSGLKSVQDRQERQQTCASQVDFFEKQKQNLKNMECTTLEEIARKLEMLHSYDDQIAAAKKQFNNGQMGHVLDEAKEIGEKIAEEAEKTAPKTPEEREKDKIEEATGSEDENKGMLSEVLDEMEQLAGELQEELEEELKDATAAEELNGRAECANLEAGMEEVQGPMASSGLAAAWGTAISAGNSQEQLEDLPDTVEEMIAAKTEQTVMEREAENMQENALERARIFRTEDAYWYQHVDYRI